MVKSQRNKKIYYLVGIVGILGLLLLIGVWRNYFENEVKKDKVCTALIKNPAHQLIPPNSVSQPKRCTLDLNGIYRLGLLGVCIFFKQYIRKDRTSITKHLYYWLAGLVLVPMVGYIGYFFYQNYSLDFTCVKDMAILFVGMPCLYLFIIHILQVMPGYPEIGFLVSNVIFYYLGRWLLKLLLSNNKLALLKQGWSFDMQWFHSACVLAYLYFQTFIDLYDEPEAHLPYLRLWRLWCIPVAFLYIQAYWSPQLSSSGYKIIDGPIAFSSDTKTLWIVLVIMLLYDAHG